MCAASTSFSIDRNATILKPHCRFQKGRPVWNAADHGKGGWMSDQEQEKAEEAIDEEGRNEP